LAMARTSSLDRILHALQKPKFENGSQGMSNFNNYNQVE